MKNYCQQKRLSFFWKAALLLFLSVFLLALPFTGRGETATLSASAASDVIEINAFETEMVIREDRKVEVRERITVRFLQSGLTMFYRSLPTEGAKYGDITATCEGNDAFSYYVASNPDVSGFLDINCVGNAQKGKTWTYDISYTMENHFDTKDSMTIDIIPFGFTVPLHNVKATVRFPAAIERDDFRIFVGYGTSTPETGGEATATLSEDGKTLIVEASVLERAYSEDFDEWVAKGVTLDFTLEEGVLDGYLKTRFFTDDMWWLLLLGVGFSALTVAVVFLTKKKREIVTVVNIKAPESMDPMKMGKLLDGTVDKEDITSMIYYFAHKGYLKIDFSNEDDPVLEKRANLEEGVSPHIRTLFNGLFASGDRVAVSDLSEKFYVYVDKATKQVPHEQMYEKRSVVGFILGGVLGVLYAVIASFALGLKLGGDYTYFLGIAFALPVAAVLLIGYIGENYRYKWKQSRRRGMALAQLIVVALGVLIFVLGFAKHISTEYERLVIGVFSVLPVLLSRGVLSRTQKYCDKLGDVLGFKEFIVVTEEEKIAFMLKEDPELYYKVLPYAQVLGVTDEWEKKFENILIEPPSWSTGTNMTVFDYWILNRMMTRAMIVATARPQPKGGGSFTGRSGGGGGFGGFGGGGFGGGGGGAR
ncbi:MAG: DUF2207 domain-containing protein [Clostridia bacterium]|nr:DUF2207 domain-containing protein [Clostridia bacterium]